MRRTFKYRLYPAKEHIVKLEEILEACRLLYNDALAERRRKYEEGEPVSYYEQKKTLVEVKKNDPHLQDVYSQVLQDVVLRLNKSFSDFYRRVKDGEKPGYPRFKGRNRYDSFTYPQSGFKIVGKKLMLSKIGSINIKLHRAIEGRIKTCTIRRNVDRWYACFSVEIPIALESKKEPVCAVGVDVGLNSLITLSNGKKIEPPKFLSKSEKKLARGQRRLSRRKKGSKNREKQRIKVAKLHRKIREQRTDFNHNLSRMLADNYDLIAFEDLRIGNMLRNHHLSKSIADASWHQLQAFTAYKAEEAGKRVVLVEPYETSQQCNNCGATMQLSRADRTYRCGCCGLSIDRDHNAALNILKRVGWDAAEYTPVEMGVPLAQPRAARR